MTERLHRALLLLFLLLTCASGALTQEATGTISGGVRDGTGAAVPGAEVAALHVATGARRTVITDNHGLYVFTALPIGTYQISVVQPGFRRSVRSDIQLHVSDHLSVDVTLELGNLSQEISVIAEGARVETQTSEQSGLISGEQIRELQLNGRSFMTLLELLPGVASDMPDRVDPNTNPALSINGARSSASNFNIDGGSNADVIVGSSSLNTFTSIDTIAELKVITSTFSAEYGRGGFSQVNVVTRGGTKRFRGSLYEFFRNDALDASDYFSHQVLPLKLNNFGYTLAGPLRLPGGYNRERDKTFFFFTQEFNRISTRGAAVNTTVPTAAERGGDFSGRGPGRDGIFGTEDDPVIDPLRGVGFPDGIIPPERMDPNALKLIRLYPLPNFRGPGTINFTSAVASQQRWREELIRIDHNFSRGWRLYGRWAQDSANIRNPYGGSSYTSVATRFPGFGATRATRPGKNLVLNLTCVITPRLLNEASLVYSGRDITQEPTNDAADRNKLGIHIPEIFPENIGNIVPTINVTGYAALNVSRVWLKQLFNLEFMDNLTKIAGRHIVKTGFIYSYGGNRENPTGPNTNGSFTFNTSFSRNALANLLLGLPFSYSEVERLVVSHARFGMLEAYVQDDFKATRNLTLNLGLRYSAYFNPYDTENVLTNFFPSLYRPESAPAINPVNGQPVPDSGDPLNGIVLAAKSSPFGRRVTNNNTDLWGPRFGFAWAPFRGQRTSIRGGYGVYYTRPLIGTFINSAFDNPPFARSVTILQPLFSNPGEGVVAGAVAPSITALSSPMLAPTIHQWSLGIQQEIFKEAILGVSYVASHGTHLFRPFNLNNPEPGQAAALGVNVNAVRPYAGYGSITQRESSASSNYNSLQVTFNRRLSSKYSLGLAYTYSKSIDDSSSDRGGSDVPPESRNKRRERGPSDFDRTHILSANYIWYFPKTARNRRLGTLLNGWELSGITRIWAGKPFDVVMSQDVAGIGGTQNQRPNVIGELRGPRTVEEWFSRNAFARPASGTFGNMGRNSLRGPGVHKWDLALYKNFKPRETVRVQFRAEAFNAFNHPSFSVVGSSLTTTAGGVNPNTNNFAVVTDTRDARVLQFALKIYY